MRLVRVVAADLGVPPAELLAAVTYVVVVLPLVVAFVVITSAVFG